MIGTNFARQVYRLSLPSTRNGHRLALFIGPWKNTTSPLCNTQLQQSARLVVWRWPMRIIRYWICIMNQVLLKCVQAVISICAIPTVGRVSRSCCLLHTYTNCNYYTRRSVQIVSPSWKWRVIAWYHCKIVFSVVIHVYLQSSCLVYFVISSETSSIVCKYLCFVWI